MAESLPSPPFVHVPGVSNFRDLGGSRLVKSGLVYRSADPSRTTPEGLTVMSRDLGIQVIYDLRSTPEIQRSGPEWAGVAPADVGADILAPYGLRREWVPVFAAADYGPDQVAVRYRMYTHENGSEGFVQAYRDILSAAPDAYTPILRHLASREPSPRACLVHCTAGKDRTGLMAALLLQLVGASDAEIADEYTLTEQGLAQLKPVFIERLLQNPALAGNRTGVENMVGAKRQNMLDTLEMIRREFGDARQYMREHCGLSDDEIDQLRKNLTP